MHHKNPVALLAFILVIVGALNWGLVGLGSLMGNDFNVVHLLLGSWSRVEAIVYLLVGVAAIYKLAMCGSHCKDCDHSHGGQPM